MTSPRPHPVRIAAFLAAVLMVLFIPPLVADDAAADPVEISSGHLDWGLKESWRNYIGAAGTTMLGEATQNVDGTFRFPVTGGGYDADTKETVVQFGGGVEFLGHCTGAGGTHVRPCALDMTLVDPRIEITEDHAALFVDSESRPIEGGEVVVDEDVQLAELDLENAAPVVADGTTTWSALANTLTVDGSRIFTYPLGTVLDPIAFTYEGPGGKPVGETWDAPGVTALTASDAAAQPSRIASRVVGRLSTGELVGWHNSGSIAVLDPDTLEPESQWLSGVSASNPSLFRDSIAIDPATDTIFAAERTTNVGDRKLVTYEWDGTDLTATEVAGSYDSTLSYDSGSGGAWDAANNRYVIARASSVAQHFIWQVKQVDGVWTASKVGRVGQVAAGSLFANALVNLEAIPDGRGGSTLVGTTLFGAGHVVRLTPVGGEFRPEKLQEAGNVNADRLFASGNGLYAVSSQDGNAVYIPYVGYADDRRLGEAKPPVGFSPFLDPNLNQGQVSFDPATDTLIGLTDSNTLITRIERGELVYRAAVDGGPYPGGMVGVNAAGEIWGEAAGKLQTLAVAGVSPRITTQPEAPVARLLGETAEIELSAAADGSPAPELTWQTRIPGSGGWQDLTAEDGADEGHLATTVGEADRGRQYRVIAENEYGRVVSDRVSLELRTPPSITVQPTDVSVGPGHDVELKVMPVGNPEPSVQWQQRLNGVWHDIPGATDPTLTFEKVELNLSGAAFRARLENELGSVISDRATVTVVPPSTEPVSFNGGSVDWGISNRWRCYVTGQIARGSVELGAGVSKIAGTTPTGSLCVGTNPSTNQPWGTGGEAYRFTVAGGSYEPATQTLEVDLKGTVRFLGHSYHAPDGIPLLDTELSDLKIRADLATGQGFVLTDAAGSTMENPDPFRYDDIKLAGFDASGLDLEARDGEVKLEGLATVLQEQGAGVITYPAGEQFDPLDMTLTVGPRDPDPEPAKPRITRVQVKRIVARTVVARVSCPIDSTTACAVRAPAKVKLAVDGKLNRRQRRAVRQRFVVRAPKTVAAGKVAAVRIVARPAQRRALRGRQLRGSLKVSAKAAGGAWVTKAVAVRGRVR
ncbi:MAG: HtaA domain-containing protein [Solirubrobacterales bacterium]|nr:HtaA domain-containing protein [Solirubrobacterales bacterium]